MAHQYPDFIAGFAVNPVHWLIPDRYEDALAQANKSNIRIKIKLKGLQVQDISLFKWL